MAYISDLHIEQTHQDVFQPGLAYNAVDAVIESPAEIEHRMAQAQNRELMNHDEALLVLLDLGMDRYLKQPVADLVNALNDEMDSADSPILWDTYNAATRALTYYSGDIPSYELDQGFERAAELLETGVNDIPDLETLGRNAVERRAQQRIENQDDEEYWPGEDEVLRDLMQEHGIGA